LNAAKTDATLARATLDAVTMKKASFAEAAGAGLIKVEGDPRKLAQLLGMLDTFNTSFEIVEPKATAKP
jgi:alkyl sulfatase BDS1-like metallo-beta-lactamase superfamily hydrolase